jgi:D-glycero-D-manno-heptose 1,7-bisphosphate phosphatase
VKRAVFLDKDGTLVENVPYNVAPERVRLVPGAAAALRLLHARGYDLVVVSNQPGVAFGYFAEGALRTIEHELRAQLAIAGVPLAAFCWCPHHPRGIVAAYTRRCACRKPAPGLLLAAARAWQLDLTGSWMIGDILDDIEAGQRAGCRTVLIDNGGETQWRRGLKREPDMVADDLYEAALAITGRRPAAQPPAAHP